MWELGTYRQHDIKDRVLYTKESEWKRKHLHAEKKEENQTKVNLMLNKLI